MGKDSEITWTHHTFNPWWGCTKISEACKYCYAESWSKRTGVKIWGSGAERRFFGEGHWLEPKKWDKESKNRKQRRRVFSASMADILEDRRDLDAWRSRLWKLIEDTPWLNWLLLTKRPENFGKMVPWDNNWPKNVWIGTTAENQEKAEYRIPILLQYPAIIRFISCEPLLGPIDLNQWLNHQNKDSSLVNLSKKPDGKIDWVIVGGESGYNARPMHPSWVRKIRDQCITTSIPFHFKQWGCWWPSGNGRDSTSRTIYLRDPNLGPVTFVWKGKRSAGRDLDGRIWDEIPEI